MPPLYDIEFRHVENLPTRTKYSLYELNLTTMEDMDYVKTLGHVNLSYKYPILTSKSYRNEKAVEDFIKLFHISDKLDEPVYDLKHNAPKTSVDDYT